MPLFRTSKQSRKKYWPWYFHLYIVTGVIGTGSALTNLIQHAHVSKPHLVISLFYLIAFLFTIGNYTIFIKYADGIVSGFSALSALRLKIGRRYNQRDPEHEAIWKKVATLQKLGVVVMVITPVLLEGPLIALNLDGFSYTFPIWFHFLPQPFIFPLRTVISVSTAIESCRFAAIFLNFTGFWLELTIGFVQVLERIQWLSDLEFLRWYSAFRIAFQIGNGPISGIVGLTMGFGFVLFVVTTVISIKCVKVLPLMVYWLMPTVSLLCAFSVYLFLPLLISINDKSEKLLKQRINNYNRGLWGLGRTGNGEMSRKYKNARAVAFSCGSLYKMRKGVDVDYYHLLVIRTADGLLLPYFKK